MRKGWYMWIGLIFLAGCGSNQAGEGAMNTEKTEYETNELGQALMKAGYDQVSLGSPFRSGVKVSEFRDSVYHLANAEDQLLELVCDEMVHPEAAFLALIFLNQQLDFQKPIPCGKSGQGRVLFNGLHGNFSGNGADWGFERDASDLGPLSRYVLDLGNEGVKAFENGLDDTTVVEIWFPWQEPPHIKRPYRVKDFAALIAAKHHEIEIDLSGGPAERDKAIRALQDQL